MQINSIDFGKEDPSPYEIHSPREIVALLRTLGEQNQLIRMLVNGGAEVVVTSILEVDVDKGIAIIDCALSEATNKRIIDASKISFETTLDKIRILFAAPEIAPCVHENRPAFCIHIPDTLIRLQRREFYRVSTPVSNPVRCTIPLPNDLGEGQVTLTLLDLSCGGISIVDEKKILDDTIGRVYRGCRIDLPGVGIVVTALAIRNSQELTLLNDKKKRRLGCQFIELPTAMLATVQRYIVKLERELNAKMNGLG